MTPGSGIRRPECGSLGSAFVALEWPLISLGLGFPLLSHERKKGPDESAVKPLAQLPGMGPSSSSIRSESNLGLPARGPVSGCVAASKSFAPGEPGL